jgi:Ca2+-binding EF-hand superfamily protein
MLRPLSLLVATASLLAVTAPVLAAAPIAPSGAKVLAALDTNKDGFIDHDEFRVGQDALFRRVDANHDGVVSRDEFNTATQRLGARHTAANADPAKADRQASRLAKLFDRMDSNKDGTIDRNEYFAAGDALFTRCDKNHDGRLTPGECRTRQAKAQTPRPPRQPQ